jgi:hypothetical protein
MAIYIGKSTSGNFESVTELSKREMPVNLIFTGFKFHKVN